MNCAQLIRNISDFPKPGIQFKDITPLLMSPQGFSEAVKAMAEPFKNVRVDKVVGIEARGFLFAAPIGLLLSAGIVPIRKHGKLPYKTERYTYQLEYGSDTIEIHQDAIQSGDHVLVVDDLLATGGTVSAACQLVETLGGKIIGVSFCIELEFLSGRKKINRYSTFSLLKF